MRVVCDLEVNKDRHQYLNEKGSTTVFPRMFPTFDFEVKKLLFFIATQKARVSKGGGIVLFHELGFGEGHSLHFINMNQ